jgi:hypothetical protein
VKFLSLNVCGIKSKLNYNEFSEFISSFDVRIFRETNPDNIDLIHITGFITFIKNSQKETF